MTIAEKEELMQALLNILPSATVGHFVQCIAAFDNKKIAEIHTESLRHIALREPKKFSL
jgi:hypothetical protein